MNNEINMVIVNCGNGLHCAKNKSLSYKAKGLYWYMSTLRGSWEIRHSDLFDRSTDGHDSTSSGINELLDTKYLYRIRHNTSKGMRWGYLIFDTPTEKEMALQALKENLPDYEIFQKTQQNPSTRFPGTGPTGSEYKVKGIIKLNRVIPKGIPLIMNKNCSKEQLEHSAERSARIDKNNIRQKIKQGLPEPSVPVIKKEIKTSPKIEQLLIHQGHHYRDKSNGAYAESIKSVKSLLKGTAFNNTPQYSKYYNRPFTHAEIDSVIERYRQALSPEFYPKSKKSLKSLTFAQLVYHRLWGSSKFVELLESPPIRYGNVIVGEDKDPVLTASFKDFYEKHVLNGTKTGEYTFVEENKFKDATVKAYRFIEANRNRMAFGLNGQKDFAQLVCNAIKEANPPEKIFIGTFNSKYTWERIVPQYFARQGVMDHVDQGDEYYGN